MRIDLFLKKSGLIKRRRIAHDLCLSGAIKLNNLIVKPSKPVKDGDRITISMAERVIEVNIVDCEEGKFRSIEI
ncbi:MAG TPA: RNA-binding S4 domain-containing protein [bacterium (Candidatus Stahlbacteria)]|nr:RNA-binding S4 domain-containing protein [Candidatus Stahlbacteria bacterium]